jgi:hypothetical protein
MQPKFILLTTLALAAGSALNPTSGYAEVVGKAVAIRTIVAGATGELKRSDPINRDERIRTNAVGVGQFQFHDGTKLAVGPNSTIVVDEYVLGSGNRAKKLAINATQGAFRWISGKSPSSAYQITTPTGTIGIRGTAVDVAIRGDTTLMVLLRGSAQLCQRTNGERRCRVVNRPCDFIVARAGQGITDPEAVSARALRPYGRAASAFPFLANQGRLMASFRVAGGCGLDAFRGLGGRTGEGTPQTPGGSPSNGNEGGGGEGPF